MSVYKVTFGGKCMNNIGIIGAMSEELSLIKSVMSIEKTFEKAGYTDIKVNLVSTSEYKKLVPNQADRPLNSRLSKKSLDEAGFKRLPDWHDAVDRYIEELKEKGEF